MDMEMTPAQFVEKWLPDYKKRWVDYCSRMVTELYVERLRGSEYARNFTYGNFSEALNAFEVDVWQRACEAQRTECAKSWENSPFDTVHEAIIKTPLTKNNKA
jgi:hypothetical protein